MSPFYQLSKEEVLQQLKTLSSGLNNEQIPMLQKEFGRNVLQEPNQKSTLSILLAQFTDVMILILIIAAVISFIVGELQIFQSYFRTIPKSGIFICYRLLNSNVHLVADDDSPENNVRVNNFFVCSGVQLKK